MNRKQELEKVLKRIDGIFEPKPLKAYSWEDKAKRNNHLDGIARSVRVLGGKAKGNYHV